jgi:hypothetical protein
LSSSWSWQSSIRGMSQIWLEVKYDYKNFLESCPVLGVYKNSFYLWKIWFLTLFLRSKCDEFCICFPQKPFEQCIFWVTTGGFFSRKFLQKFNLKNVISTNTNDFSWGKWSKLAKFRKEKKFKLPDFYNKFQSVVKNIEGSWVFLLSYLAGSQNWLN